MTGMDAPAIGDLAAEHGIAVHELFRRHASLEQAYLDITKESVEYRAGSPTRSEAMSRPMTGPVPLASGPACHRLGVD